MTLGQKEMEKRNFENVAMGMEFFRRGDIDGFITLLSPDYVWYDSSFARPLVGLSETREGLKVMLETFPDWKVGEMTHVCTRDNWLTCSFSNWGTEVNGFVGLPPINCPWSFELSAIHKFGKDGLRIESRIIWSPAKILQDLGLLPPGFFHVGGCAGEPDSVSLRHGDQFSFLPFDSRQRSAAGPRSDDLGSLLCNMAGMARYCFSAGSRMLWEILRGRW